MPGELNRLALIDIQNGKLDEALAKLLAAEKKDPGFPNTYINRGIIYSQLQNYSQAVSCFESALWRMPQRYRPKSEIAEVRLKLAQAQFELGCKEDKISRHDATLKTINALEGGLDGNEPGELLTATEKLKQEVAKIYSAWVQKLFPNITEEKSDTKSSTENKRELKDGNLDAMIADPETQFQMGRYSEAIKQYQKILKKFDHPLIYLNLAKIFITIGLFDYALKFLQRSLDLSKNEKINASIYVNFGLCHRGLKNYDTAIKYCEQAIELAKNLDEANYHLGLIYVAQGIIPLALHFLQVSLQNNYNPAQEKIAQLRNTIQQQIKQKTQIVRESKDTKDSKEHKKSITLDNKTETSSTTTTSTTTAETNTAETKDAKSVSLGLKIEGIEYLEPIAIGSVSVVWRALRIKDNQEIAVKQLSCSDGPGDEDFSYEEKFFAAIGNNSPYVVHWFATLKVPHCLVLEWVPRTLYTVLTTETVSWDIRFQIAKDITNGLHVIHDKNWLHRDLKSTNILITNEYRAKLADFNLSGSQDEWIDTGTENFKAPEVPKTGCTVKSDTYMLGGVFYEMILPDGKYQQPFHELIADFSGNYLIHNIRKAKAAKQQPEIPSSCHPKLAKLISLCWDLDPDKRPTTAKVLESLEVKEESAQNLKLT